MGCSLGTGGGKCLSDPKLCDRWAAAVARWVIDANLLSDAENLHVALETLRSAHARLAVAGSTARAEIVVTVLLETTRAALERARQAELEDTLDPDTWAAKMLLVIHDIPGLTSQELASKLPTTDSQVSRSGRALIERGLVIKTRHGQERCWRASARGAVAARKLQRRATARAYA